jgi:UDP-N-acetylmuramate--alanine ligase
MHIYFSGIGGVGIGPLAEIAHDAGYDISGSDLRESPMTKRLSNRGVAISIGQTRETIAALHAQQPIDWFVFTAALASDHPELAFAREQNIRTSKRDELLSYILKDKNLKLIAVSGTHGKTTTTGMLVWLFQQLNLPVSYLIGTTISFGPSGKYDPKSEYFVYECDEYDRNLLNFFPDHAVITSLDYDHPDTYPTLESYNQAFLQFINQSKHMVMWQHDSERLGELPKNVQTYNETTAPTQDVPLVGHNRHNGWLASAVVAEITAQSILAVAEKLRSFPGTHRRFEKLADNLYSDYGHHPAEVASTLAMAREISDHVVLVYQPHQNLRQHEVRDQYTDCMEQAEMIYWLPTYLSREDPKLEVLTPKQLIANLTNREAVVVGDLNDELWRHIESERRAGSLVVCMGAGSIDEWVRERLPLDG